MLIPVFVSCPTALNARQERSRQMILAELKHLPPKLDASERTALTEVFLKWQFKVRDLYYK
ncbi:MAG TPA: hypothetical protein VII34_14200 [Pyrinomonadaceae bacterium]